MNQTLKKFRNTAYIFRYTQELKKKKKKKDPIFLFTQNF